MKKYIYEIKFYIFAQIICDAIVSLSIALIPYLNKQLFDQLEIGRLNKFLSLIAIYIVCILIGIIFSYTCSIYIWKGALKFETSLKRDFFRSIFNYKYQDFILNDVGEYISIQGNDIQSLEQDYLEPIIDIIKSINMISIYGIILFIGVDWRIALIILILSICTVLISKLTAKELSNKRDIYQKQIAKYVSKIKDYLEGFKCIQSRTINNINREHEKVLDNTKNKRLSYGKFKVLSLTISTLTINIINISAFITVGFLLINDEITIGTAVATFGYIDCFIDPIESILYDLNAINSMKKTKEKVLSYIKNSNTNNLMLKDKFNSDILFKNVSFNYKNFTLENINYRFEKGKKYAIIGHSGSGKSTLVNMLMKYIIPNNGKILIDGLDTKNIDTSKIMYSINQDEHIFNDNFKNNVTVFSSYSYKILKSIIQSFNINIINTIKEKESSQKLSGGEKQILSILRMLSANTSICIMDESFSAIDVNTSKIIRDKIFNMKNKTIIMVTHRLSEDLKLFDEIILMDNGKIIQNGKYNDIINTIEFENLKTFL